MLTLSVAVPIALAILKVAVVALAGFVLARRGLLHQSALTDLSNLVVTVTVPCLVFANAAGGIRGTSLAAGLFCLLAAPFLLALGFAGAACLGPIFGVDKSHRRAVVSTATFQNANYLPLAVATSVAAPLATLFPSGPATLPDAISGSSVMAISLFTTVYSPVFWGWGLWWVTTNPGEALPRGMATWRMLLPPPVIGIMLGYLFGLTPLHQFLTPPMAPLRFLFDAIRDIGGLTIPLANLILGGMLALVGKGRFLQWRDAATSVLVKLLFVPAVTLGLLYLIRSWWRHDAALAVAAFIIFLEASTPPATNLAVMAKRQGNSTENVTGQIIPGLLLVNYSLALVTLPLWLTAFFQILRRH